MTQHNKNRFVSRDDLIALALACNMADDVYQAVAGSNPYASYARSLRVEEREYRYYQIRELGAEK